MGRMVRRSCAGCIVKAASCRGDQLCEEGSQDWVEALPAMEWVGQPLQASVMPDIRGTSFVVGQGRSELERARARGAKDRGVYLVLGVLFGFCGLHNLYVERVARGAGQFALSALGVALLLLGVPMGALLFLGVIVWSLVETFTDFSEE